ncbi:MAG: hypothetical protein NTW86_03655 [Candidatus Sumerlaeota bacterium]|nr:hypothetical protein [Candidatus Sumerlaeota bacterium]
MGSGKRKRMSLPNFNSAGDLPEGVYPATIDEALGRFGTGTPQRQAVTARLLRVYRLAAATGKLDRLILFGSYITATANPNDVDLVLVMRDNFDVRDYEGETQALFDHQRAAEVFEASIFWIRPALLLLETVEEFIAYWQIKRDETRRGIVEVRE